MIQSDTKAYLDQQARLLTAILAAINNLSDQFRDLRDHLECPYRDLPACPKPTK